MEEIFEEIIREVFKHVIQLKDRRSPETAEWIPANGDRATGGIVFVNDRLPSGK